LAAVSLDAVLRRALSLCFDVINAERGVLFVRTDKGIQPVAAFRRGEGFVPPSDVHYSSTIVQHVVDTRVAMLSRDALTEDDLRVAVSIVRLNIRSALCVPLWLEQESLGAIYLDNCAASYAFTPQDMELLTAIAHVVAVRMRQDRLARRLQQEEFLRANLARYQPPDVVEMILREGTVRLGIRVRPVSVLFADLVDSTRLAERAGPEATAEILNRFYEIVARVVFEERGHVNNYIGDGVISIFNATIDLEDHPAAAVRAALRIVRETVRFARENPRFPVQVRVGVNTGEAAVGNVGAEGRIQYTALGDPVNAAERLCKLADPNGVVVGHETYEHAARMFRFLPLGEVTLKGRDRPLAAYALEIAP
jgi:class 3 adenylate cyclase